MLINLSLIEMFCIALAFLGVGFFLGAALLPAWLDERDDRFAEIKYSQKLTGSSGLARPALPRIEAVSTLCAYCQKRTNSLWCEAHGHFYCLSHAVQAHKGCSAKLALKRDLLPA